MAKISPLLKMIDAIRWDDEGLLGRLIVLVHAAFLDAGFLLLPLLGRNKRGPVPREAGRTASTLSLRYTVLELLQLPRHDADAAVLRLQVYGRKIVLYVQCAGRQVASSLVVVDALDAAPLRSETSWKERYVRARRGWLPRTWLPWYRPIGAVRIRLWNGSYVQPSYSDSLTDDFDFLRLFDDRDDDPPEDPIPVRRKWTKAANGKCADARRSLQLQGKRQQGTGAIHDPSSRYRWKHR
ncbi:hypothetical protein QOZ80_5BG0423300 [Eleusine coracana subsp. coracana]|nr:hypothetical protein QOZ80_5BG0423300 [Eleusine coracana subsp. coracana]